MTKYILILASLLLSVNANAAGNTGSAIAPPTYAGYIVEKGDLGWTSKSTYKSRFSFAMPLGANALCDDEFPGSRAAYYDDFKYVYNTLPSADNYIVIDAIKNHYDHGGNKIIALKDGQTITKTALTTQYYCDWYTSTSSSRKTIVLKKSTGSLAEQTCNLDVRLVCVRD